MALNAQVLARLGVAVLTVYDALNDNLLTEERRKKRCAGRDARARRLYADSLLGVRVKSSSRRSAALRPS